MGVDKKGSTPAAASDQKEEQQEGQMRRSRIKSPPTQTLEEPTQGGSCGFFEDKLADSPSKDSNCHHVHEANKLEVELRGDSLLGPFSGQSRSLSIRTNLVRSIKSKSLANETIGRTIRSFVDNLCSSLNESPQIGAKSKSKQREPDLKEKFTDSFDIEARGENGHKRDSSQKRGRANYSIGTSVSSQSMLTNSTARSNLVDEQQQQPQQQQQRQLTNSTTTTKESRETCKSGESSPNTTKDNLDRINDVHVSSNISNFSMPTSNINTNNMASGFVLAKNKYVVEDKLKKQQQSSTSRCNSNRLEDRRSTYCSSVGAATTDLNYDSSFSSANNCSDSNNICAMVRQSSSKDLTTTDRLNIVTDSISPSIKQYREHNKNLKNERLKKRDNWNKNIEFLLAVIGFAVDLGNVWRFPYICYKNGGGAFLIPYTIMFILGGLPIFYLEMSLGQYFSSGCLTVWKRVCPMAKGIGYAMCVLNFFTGLYYNTIISWAVFFFVESFTTELPWTSCNNPWNSLDCATIDQRQANKSLSIYSTSLDSVPHQVQPIHFSSPTRDYFEREVLQVHLSTGIDDLGSIRKPLAIYLAVVFICIYFAIWKGVKSTGKAVWITALLPYFVLIPLLIRGLFLEGSWLGIKYYLYPQWKKILDIDVWVEAAKQIYFSLGPGFGTLMALSSYNKFDHNCRRDALIAASVNYFASFISGLVIFAVLGYMATIENVSINDVATEGPGLVFQVYPEGLATMRFSALWSILFFIMVITLGIDSTFGGLESVITGLCDEYPRILRAHRSIFIGILIVLIYLCSLPTTTYGGNYVIYVLESYGTSLSLLFLVLIETIIVCWCYGADKFCRNLKEMSGEMPGAYWRICWKYISPTILLIIFFAACGQELNKYHTLKNGDYTYPGWAPTVGLLMTASSVCCIPIYAIYYLKEKTSGSLLERIKIGSTPIENEQRTEKEMYVDPSTDNIRVDNDIHLDTVI